MYKVELSQRAQEFLEKLDTQLRERIEKRLKNLEENPVPSDAKFICRENQEKIFRYRIGNYRALYKIKGQGFMIEFILQESVKSIYLPKGS